MTEKEADENLKNCLDLIEKWGEENKPPTLKERLIEWYGNANLCQSKDVIANEIVNVVKDWLKNYHKEDNNKYDFDYFSGWADCIDILERDLR